MSVQDNKPVIKRQRATRVQRLTLEDGREGWLYSDGTVRDDRGGYLLRDPNGADPITPETARIRERQRKEKFERAAGRAIAEKGGRIDPRIRGPVGAWGHMVGAMYQKTLDAEKPNAQAAEFVGKAIGAMNAGNEPKEPVSEPVRRMSAGAELELVARVLYEALHGGHNITYDNQQGADVVDAQASDPEPPASEPGALADEN